MITALTVLFGVALFVFLLHGGGRSLSLLALEPVGVAVPTLACLIFLFAPQMAYMMAALAEAYGPDGEGQGSGNQLWFGVAVLGLGAQSWYWTRAALNARMGEQVPTTRPMKLLGAALNIRAGIEDRDTPGNLPWQERWAPRLALLPTAVIAASPLLMAVNGDLPWQNVPWGGVLSGVAACAVVAYFAWKRRRNRRVTEQPIALATLAGPHVLRLLQAAPYGPVVAVLLLIVGIIGFVLAQAAPALIRDHLHTPTAAMLAISCLVPVAATLLALLRDVASVILLFCWHWISILFARLTPRWTQSPPPAPIVADWLGLLLLVMLPVAGAYSFPSAYEVATAGPHPHRPGIQDAVRQYLACHQADTPTGQIPAVIVLAEGGASRSAVWTLSMMRELDASTGGAFGRHLFAISSVSGGSLAAVTYALQQARAFHGRSDAPTAEEEMRFWQSTRRGLLDLARRDLLAPSITRLFTSDLLLGVPRRGAALEGAFRQYWQDANGLNLGRLAESGVAALHETTPCAPHLLLNGTDVYSGDRLLTSTIAFDGYPGPFPGAVDVLKLRDADIPPAAAVLNSARFPVISPPGRLSGDQGDKWVIDGGVFENFGARTAWELMQAIQAVPEASGRLLPIVVLITNDANHPASTCTNDLNPEVSDSTQSGNTVGLPEFLTSPLGLYATRGGHARAELGFLHHTLCNGAGSRLFHYDLPAISKATTVPMNWVMDDASCAFMLGQARDANQEQIDKLAMFLNGLAPGPANTRPFLAEAAKDALLCKAPLG